MEQNFDQLRKLLALKRYEQPPPGYFQNFSCKVITRIEAAEMAEPVSWWEKLGFGFNLRPALMCALSVVVCGLLSIGVISSLFGSTDQPPVGLAMAPGVDSPAALTPFNASDAVVSSTQPVFASSRFDQFGARVQPALFQLK
ncbi:MAG TPA: hypothetical protein VK615_04490 [Candidatus Binatia bacterium]|nr:hypothetical protein [Candidatus Binatia bacterium]